MEKSISPEDYERFRLFLEGACGIILGDNKHYLVSSRLNRIMREFEIGSLGDLVGRITSGGDAKLRERIIDAMTTNETLWFRDSFPFDILKERIIPELSKARKRSQPLRIWSAASSSGQEPYSISIAVHEYAASNPGSMPGGEQIIATDISPSMLKDAARGAYDNVAVSRGMSAERKQRFFTTSGDKWEVKPEIRARVTFKELNLMQGYGLLGRFDVIFCRNVLIYFSTELKRDILNRMAKVLNPQGYLFLGASESIASYCDAFEMVRCQPGVVYRLKPGYK